MPDGLERPTPRPTPRSMATTALGEVSLADVRAAIARDETVPAWKRAQWKSAIKRLGEFLGRDLASMPARPRALRPALSTLHHTQLGITKARLRNIKSDLRAALGHCGHIIPGLGTDQELAPAWRGLHDRLTETRHRRGLIRFFRFCSFRGIGPKDVADATVTAFLEAVIESGFLAKPKDLHRSVCRFWNDCGETIPGWPRRRVIVPDNRPAPKSVPWADFPESFRQDVDAYLAWLSGEDLLAKTAPVRACNAKTRATRRRYIHLAASAATRRGVPIADLGSLADLVRPDVVKHVLEDYLEDNGGEPKVFVIDLAQLLRSIARVWVKIVDPALAELTDFTRVLERHRKSGFTDKNSAVVRTFRDSGNWNRLRALPGQLMDQAMTETSALRRAAIKAQLALAIQILLVAPMRVGNLVALSLDKNVIRVGGPDCTYHLVIPDTDVKNGVPLEYPLPKAVSDMLVLYITMFRNRVKGANSEWLFPGKDGHKRESTMSGQITKLIRKELGPRVTPHQFRHICGAKLLQAHPGNYELVRRVLGHKSLNTTTRAYIGLESVDAARHYAELVLGDDPADD